MLIRRGEGEGRERGGRGEEGGEEVSGVRVERGRKGGERGEGEGERGEG